MSTIRNKLALLLSRTTVLGLVLTSLHGAALARSTPASAGRPSVGADENCLNIDGYGGVIRNDCGYALWYEIPMPADGSPPDEWYDVWVAAKGLASGQSVACGAHGVTYDSSGVPWYSFSNPNLRWLDVLGRFVDIYVPVYVPPGGSLLVDCLLEPNGRVMQAQYR